MPMGNITQARMRDSQKNIEAMMINVKADMAEFKELAREIKIRLTEIEKRLKSK